MSTLQSRTNFTTRFFDINKLRWILLWDFFFFAFFIFYRFLIIFHSPNVAYSRKRVQSIRSDCENIRFETILILESQWIFHVFIKVLWKEWYKNENNSKSTKCKSETYSIELKYHIKHTIFTLVNSRRPRALFAPKHNITFIVSYVNNYRQTVCYRLVRGSPQLQCRNARIMFHLCAQSSTLELLIQIRHNDFRSLGKQSPGSFKLVPRT